MNKYFLLVLLCLSLNNLYAQKYKEMMADMDINFYDVCAEAEAYFKTIDKDQKGSGYKNYLRWKQENESRYAPDGVRNNVSPYFVQEQYEQFLNQQKKTRAIHNNWRELGPRFIDTITGHYAAGLGRVEDVFVDKNNTNKVYLGTRSGGFWRTINGGTSWQGTTDTLFASGVNAITASPTNSDSVLINCRNASNGTSHGIYRSINGGLTWTITNFNPTSLGMGGLGSNFQVYKIYYHPTVSNLIFVGTNEGLYRSTNNLQTWTQIQAGADITQIEFHPTNPNIMYIYDNTSGGANENKVLVSTNMGVSFTPSAVITGNSNNTIFLSTSNQCPNCLYVGSNGGVWKSIDSGKNYTLISNPNQSIRAIAVNTFDTSKIVAGYVDLFNSFNGGQNFNQCTFWSLGNSAHNANSFAGAFDSSSVYIHADANIMKCINGVFYAGTDGYIAKSSDNGVSWQRISEGVGSREYYCLGTSQNNHFVTMCGSQDNGESIRNQNGWIEFYGADGMEGIIHPLNEDWIIGSVQYGNRRRTKNGGYTQDGASPNVSDGAWVAPLAYNPTNPMQLFDFTDSVMRSDNFGTSWNYVGKPFNGNITSAAIAENNSNIMVVSFNSNIYKSIDAGVTYTNIKNNLPTYTITDIAFDPTNDDIIVVTYNRYQNDGQKVFITTNGGSNWVNITHNLGNMPIKSVVIDHSSKHNIYVGAEIGIYVKAMNDTT